MRLRHLPTSKSSPKAFTTLLMVGQALYDIPLSRGFELNATQPSARGKTASKVNPGERGHLTVVD